MEAQGRTQVRWVLAGGHSVSSGGPPEVHFGLGDATGIDRVVIHWPDGAWSELLDVPVKSKALVQRLAR